MRERSSTLGTWIKRFLMEYLPTERNLAVNTLKSYRDGLTLLLPFVAGRCGKAVERLAVEDLSADRVTAFLGHLEQERGCSVQTRNLRLTAIRSFARYVAVRDAALVEWAGSIRAIPLKKTVRPRIIWLPAQNMDAMIAGPDRRTVAGRVEHALLLFLYNSGARASEAAGLQVEDLHLPERTGENARATIHGKGGKIRITPLWTSTAKALVALSRDRPPGCESVFWSRHRKPYTRHGIIELVERAAARVPELNGQKITPHVLRHSCACHLLRSGVDINTIRAWLGHVSLATTNIYAEVDLEAKEKAMKSTYPGDIGDEPRWKARGDLLEQLKAI